MLGSQIRIARKKLGLSQEELAERAGVHHNTIARWERGELDPRGTSIAKHASALNTTVAYLTGETDAPERPDHFGEVNEMIKPGPEAVKEPQIKTEDKGMLIYTSSNGEKIELPATEKGYALFERLLAEKGALPANMKEEAGQ